MSTVIRSLMVKVGADFTEMQKGLKKAAKELKNAGKDMKDTGSSLTAGLTVPISAAIAGLTGLAVTASITADDLITLSNKSGVSLKALQELQYAARFVDVEVETMTGSMQKLTKSMDTAKEGTGEQAEAFKSLGIETLNADGSLRDAKTVWFETIDALGDVTSETERNALSMSLFGKSAAELNPLIVAGVDELKKLSEEAHEVGAVLSDESVKSLGKFNDQIEKLKAVTQTAAGNIGVAFLPVIERITPIVEEKIVPAIKSLAGFLTELITRFENLSPGAQSLVLSLIGFAVAIGPVLTVIGRLSIGISGVVGAVGSVIGVISKGGGIISALTALIGPAGIVLIVITAIAAAAYLIITNWESIKGFFSNLWEYISGVFVSTWEGLRSYLEGLWTWLQTFFSELPVKISETITNIFNAISLWGVNFMNWIIVNIPILIGKIIGFFASLPGLITQVINGVITAISTWANSLITKAAEEVPRVVRKVVELFKSLPSEIEEIGKRIVTGLWTGMNSMMGWIKDRIKEFAKSIISGIKKSLGINSPSKVMASQVGKWIPAGIAEGITGNAGLIQAAMNTINNQLRTESLIDTKGTTSMSSNNGAKSEESAIGNRITNLTFNVQSYSQARHEIELLNKQLATAVSI